MSQILAVFGATGQQGGSVIDFVLGYPELSQKFKVRGITRDVGSDAAAALRAKGVEVVRGDADDRASLDAALAGAHTVFAMTAPAFGPGAEEAEYASAVRIADASVAAGAAFLVFSTLPSAAAVSGGKYTSVATFEAKARAERYICGLPIRSAFYAPGAFMQNFGGPGAPPFLAPKKSADSDTWVLARHTAPSARLPLIDAAADSGKFVGAILADPDRFEGKTLCAAVAHYSLTDIAACLSRSAGVPIVYRQVSVDEFRAGLPPPAADIFTEVFGYQEEFGYYGPDSERLVAWGIENARGKLTTFEEYLEAHPFRVGE